MGATPMQAVVVETKERNYVKVLRSSRVEMVMSTKVPLVRGQVVEVERVRPGFVRVVKLIHSPI